MRPTPTTQDGLDISQHHQHHHDGVVRHRRRGVGDVLDTDAVFVRGGGVHVFGADGPGHSDFDAVFVVDAVHLVGDHHVRQNVHAVHAGG